MVKDIAKKIEDVEAKIEQLSDAARGCCFCQGNCYQLIAPHLAGLRQWLTQSQRLDAAVMDNELTWIFGKSLGCQRGDSDSDDSHDSFESVVTQDSNSNCNRKRKRTAQTSWVRHCKTSRSERSSSPEGESFVTDSTADSDADGIDLCLEYETLNSCSSKGVKAIRNKRDPQLQCGFALNFFYIFVSCELAQSMHIMLQFTHPPYRHRRVRPHPN